MIILDTNVVSALMQDPRDPAVLAWLNAQAETSVWMTSITVLECRFGIERLPKGRRRDGLARAFDEVVTEDLDGRILDFAEADAAKTAVLMARRQAVGLTMDLRDAMIAGVANVRRAQLATGNTKHFKDTGLTLVDPFARS